MKDLSDANRAVKRLKQTQDVGVQIHAMSLANLRTVSISDAALGLDRPGLHDERRVGRMRMDQRRVGVGGLSRLRTLNTSTEIKIIARRSNGDRHESG